MLAERSITASSASTRRLWSSRRRREAAEAGLARTYRSFDAPAPYQDDDGATLSERNGARNERLAVHLRFREDMTQTEMGRHIGCSQMHVSRILRSALARLENEAAAPLRGG